MKDQTPESGRAWRDCIAWLNGRDEREDPQHVALANLAERLERERDEARRQWNVHQDRLAEAHELIAEIMREEVNITDECEKWLRAYCPEKLGRAGAAFAKAQTSEGEEV